MESIRTALQGWKTYIVAALVVLTALLAFTNGEAGLFETVVVILNGLGLGTLRAGIKTGPAL